MSDEDIGTVLTVILFSIAVFLTMNTLKSCSHNEVSRPGHIESTVLKNQKVMINGKASEANELDAVDIWLKVNKAINNLDARLEQAERYLE